MDVIDFFVVALKNKKNALGLTDEALGRIAGCHQPKINGMLNGTKKKSNGTPAKTAHEVMEKTEFITLVRLFPELFDKLIKDVNPNVTVHGNGSAASVNGNATAAPVTIGAVKESGINLGELSAAILNDDKICDACKVKVLKLLQKKQ